MGRILLFFFLWIALEIYTFVVVGQAIGFLLTIFLLFLVSYLGLMVTKKLLARDLGQLQRVAMLAMSEGVVDLQDEQANEEREKLEKMTNEERAAYLMSLKKRTLFDQVMILMFIIPGFLTDVIAIILLLINIKASLFDKSIFDNPIFEKANVFGKRDSKYQEYMNKNYGKSTRDLEKEAEARAKEEQGSVPRENPNAGQATIEEMKAKFQAQKEVKDAKFEELPDDDNSGSSMKF